MDRIWVAWFRYCGSRGWATALATFGLHEAVRIAGHVYQAAPSFGRHDNVTSINPTTSVAYKISLPTRLSFLLEHVAEISLFAAFPPKTRLFDIVILTPFPHPSTLLLQVCALLLVEERFRSWAHRVPASWITTNGSVHGEDMASLLAIEYIIPKGALSLVMLGIGLLGAIGVPLPTLHLAAVVAWTALRQFRVFEKGLDWNQSWGFNTD